MSKREEIKDGFSSSNRKSGLVYTKILGWIDLGHACGDDAKRLKAIYLKKKTENIFLSLMIGISLSIIFRKWSNI